MIRERNKTKHINVSTTIGTLLGLLGCVNNIFHILTSFHLCVHNSVCFTANCPFSPESLNVMSITSQRGNDSHVRVIYMVY